MKTLRMSPWLLAAALLACQKDAPAPVAPQPEPAARQAAPAQEPVKPPAKATMHAAPAGDEPVEALVVRERARVEAEGGRLLVYVGATWCEPCRRFHDAVARGELDGHFGGVTFLEFDFDRDVERLRPAGYASKMIPLFALPGEDGKASGKQLMGAISGDGAVRWIIPRLRKLLKR